MEPSGELAQRGGGPGPESGSLGRRGSGGDERGCVCRSDHKRGREGGVCWASALGEYVRAHACVAAGLAMSVGSRASPGKPACESRCRVLA